MIIKTITRTIKWNKFFTEKLILNYSFLNILFCELAIKTNYLYINTCTPQLILFLIYVKQLYLTNKFDLYISLIIKIKEITTLNTFNNQYKTITNK